VRARATVARAEAVLPTFAARLGARAAARSCARGPAPRRRVIVGAARLAPVARAGARPPAARARGRALGATSPEVLVPARIGDARLLDRQRARERSRAPVPASLLARLERARSRELVDRGAVRPREDGARVARRRGDRRCGRGGRVSTAVDDRRPRDLGPQRLGASRARHACEEQERVESPHLADEATSSRLRAISAPR
jgi:hypothetical protein